MSDTAVKYSPYIELANLTRFTGLAICVMSIVAFATLDIRPLWAIFSLVVLRLNMPPILPIALDRRFRMVNFHYNMKMAQPSRCGQFFFTTHQFITALRPYSVSY